MLLKIFNSILILFAVLMGIKHGWNMLNAKPEMLDFFSKWGKDAVIVQGALTFISALLILHPRTFFWGNFLMAACILLIIFYQIQNNNIKGAAIELPFILLNVLIVYLKYRFNT